MGFVTGNRKLNLFAVTSDSVSVVEITREGPGDVEALDEKGCEVGCATVTSTDELVIGRKEVWPISLHSSYNSGYLLLQQPWKRSMQSLRRRP